MRDNVQRIWQKRLREALARSPRGRTLAAFNLNVDVVAHVTPMAIRRLIDLTPDLDWDRVASIDVDALRSVSTREEFVAVLRHGFATGKSNLLVRETEELVPWWREIFAERTESMGGQAGIIANQMAALGAESIVYSPALSPRQAALFLDGVLWPHPEGDAIGYVPARRAGRPGDVTREPWVFEFAKGERFAFPDGEWTTPRANRAIVTTAIQGPERSFHEDIRSALPRLGQSLDVAFLAGYHQCGSRPDDPGAVRAYIDRSCRDLAQLRSGQPRLKLHIEYVPAKAREMERELYTRLGREIHSFGINETESRGVLRRFGHDRLADELERKERAFLLYQGGLSLLRELGVERIHVHNLGYYVVILRKPYGCAVETVRDACLYASAVNAMKARTGGCVRAEAVGEAGELPLSQIGFDQLQSFAREAAERLGVSTDRFLETGVLEFDDHIVVVAPAHVISDPAATVGMGDTISSSAYYYETCGGAGRRDVQA